MNNGNPSKLSAAKSSTTNQQAPKIAINYTDEQFQSGGFVAFPRFWVDEYFKAHTIEEGTTNKNGSTRKAQRVPASFWKYTMHLWRWVSVPRKKPHNGRFYITDIAIDQFPVRADAATMWTAAYAVSGVMEVQMGRWTKQHDDPTVFTYNPATSKGAWRCFFIALDNSYNLWQRLKKKRSENLAADEKIGSNVGAWKVLVAREVDARRTLCGLEPVNTAFLNSAAAGSVTDQYNRRIAERDEAGNIQPIFYTAVPRWNDVFA